MRKRVIYASASALLVTFLCLGFALDAAGPTGPAYRYLSLFAEVLGLVRSNYVDEVDQPELLEGAYKGILAGLDPFSGYLTPEEYQAASRAAEQPADVGIGFIKASSALVIVSIAPGSPAEAAGLEIEDQIWYIDGRSVREMGLAQADRALHGQPGSEVLLQVFEMAQQKRTEFRLTRVVPSAPAFASHVEPGGTGYLAISDPARASREALATALKELETGGATRLLLDLRGATSGELEDALAIAGLFVGDNTVTRTAERQGVERVYKGIGPVVWRHPTFVLVNRHTAGSAEIVASALHDGSGARLLGEQTTGYGARQDIIPLPGGDALVLSVARYLSPSGESWYKKGVDVDVAIAADPEQKYADREAERLKKAVEIVDEVSAGERRAA